MGPNLPAFMTAILLLLKFMYTRSESGEWALAAECLCLRDYSLSMIQDLELSTPNVADNLPTKTFLCEYWCPHSEAKSQTNSLCLTLNSTLGKWKNVGPYSKAYHSLHILVWMRGKKPKVAKDNHEDELSAIHSNKFAVTWIARILHEKFLTWFHWANSKIFTWMKSWTEKMENYWTLYC